MNDEKHDSAILGKFLEERSEAAFNELIERHLDLVYSVALRVLRGDSHLAKDATQGVFCELARSAGKLRSHRNLSGWLYNTTRFVSLRLTRSESRRAAREKAFAMNSIHQGSSDASWEEVDQVLDDALGDLPSGDREAVILRFFRDESFSSIGSALGFTENAARMRVARALEKLRVALQQRGVTCSSSVLSALIVANAIGPVPSGLAASIGPGAAAPAVVVSSAGPALDLLNIMTATKLKIAVTALALTGTTTGWLMQKRESSRLKTELTIVRSNLRQFETAPAVVETEQSADELARARAQISELLQLRAEVTDLRQQVRRNAQAATTAPAAATQAEDQNREAEERELLKMRGLAKMKVATAWAIAFQEFTAANDGQMPKQLSDAKMHFPQLPAETLRWIGTPEGDFEQTFHGVLSEIENPAEAIILRDKEPFHTGTDGSAQRTYLFADGHAEIHKAKNGDFTEWEEKRQPQLKESPRLEASAE